MLQKISKIFLSYGVIAVLAAMCLSSPAMADDSYLEKGKQYKLTVLTVGGLFPLYVGILSKPDDHGWVKIIALDEKTKRELKLEAEKALLNLNQIFIAEEY